MRRVGVIVPAAGEGRRLGGVRKPFLELAGRPMLQHTLRPFLECDDVASIVVALAADDAAAPPAWLAQLAPRVQVVAGGAERGDSVARALAALPDGVDVVLVHDAARPLLDADLVARCIDAAAGGVSVIAAVRVTDTVKEVGADGLIEGTPDRSRLWRAQTPQAFPRAVLEDAYRQAASSGTAATDDAALVAQCGGRVLVIEGADENMKVTTPTDVFIAEALLRQRTAPRAAPGVGSFPASPAGGARPQGAGAENLDG
jgi:2-C-methyl-D-erythritol 4-phosphate cytidylyltransferase